MREDLLGYVSYENKPQTPEEYEKLNQFWSKCLTWILLIGGTISLVCLIWG